MIAMVVTFLMRPEFSSTAQIEIEPDIISDVPTITGSGNYAPYDPYFMETQVKAIQGEVVLSRVVNALNLNAIWGKRISPDGSALKTSETIDYLRRNISLDPDRNTKLINITVYDEDKNLAAEIANTIVQCYKEYRLEQHQNQMESGIQKLEQDYETEDSQIWLMQSNVDELREKLGIHDIDPNSTYPTPTITAEQIQQMTEKLMEQKALLIESSNQYAELESIQATNPTMLRDVLPTLITDSALSDLLSKLHDSEQKYVTETNFVGAKSPDRAATLALIYELNSQIDARVTGIMLGMRDKVISDQYGVDAITQQLNAYQDQNQDEAVRGAPYWAAKLALQDKRELHKFLAARIESDKADAMIPHSALVTVINPAQPGLAPVRPAKVLNISLGAFFGLLVGVSLAFFIEYLDTSVKTIDEVERVFQAPVLGVIPQNVGRLIEEGVDSSHAEAYRVLRTNILFSRKDQNLNSIVVVSAGMGEGKSTTVLNLATIFAQAGQRTLVVDSDLRRPTLHKLLHLSNNIGLVNYLLKQNTLEQVIQTTPVPLLDFMASGKLPGNAMNILGSEPMRNLITELKLRYDFILFDSPPIMGLSDASVLASEVDMAIQIIQYRRYPQLMNIRAKQMVEKVGGNLVGIVLNNINMAQDESYYYYGGYYYHSNEDAKDDPKNPSSDNGDSSGDGGRLGVQQKY